MATFRVTYLVEEGGQTVERYKDVKADFVDAGVVALALTRRVQLPPGTKLDPAELLGFDPSEVEQKIITEIVFLVPLTRLLYVEKLANATLH